MTVEEPAQDPLQSDMSPVTLSSVKSISMTYSPEQISQIVLKVLKEIETPDVLSLSYDQKLALAQNPNTPVETLKTLATDENSDVRYWVARNPNTSTETLKTLATDVYYVVRCCVAQNPNTSPETLQSLATDEDSDVRRSVAYNPNTSPEVLQSLATDENYYVRCCVAENPNYKSNKTLELTSDQFNALKELIESGQNPVLKSLL